MTRSRPALSRDSLVASVARAVEAVRAARAAAKATATAAGSTEAGSAKELGSAPEHENQANSTPADAPLGHAPGTANAAGSDRAPQSGILSPAPAIARSRRSSAAAAREPSARRETASAGAARVAASTGSAAPLSAPPAPPAPRAAEPVAKPPASSQRSLRPGRVARSKRQRSAASGGVTEPALAPEAWTLPKPQPAQPLPARSAANAVRAPKPLRGSAAPPWSGCAPAPAADGEAERRRLWRDYRRCPNDQTRNRLVEAYQPLVREIVSRFGARLPRSVDRGDLATAGNMGLIAAIQSFDGRRGVRFEAYGDRRIRGALLDELRTQDWLPRPWRRRLERHKQVTERLCAELGREPHDEELAAALGLSVADYQSLFGLAWPLAPGGAGRAAEGDDDAWLGELEVVPDPRARAADEELTREELLALCAQRMSPQEHRIVYLKYWQELSLREIGALTGLSESRICKIHAQLLERLAERLAGHAADL